MDGERDKKFFTSLAYAHWSFDFSYEDRRKYDPTGVYLGDPLTSGQYQRDRSLLTQLQYQDSFADDTLQLTGRLFLGQHRYTGRFNYDSAPTFSTGSGDWQGGELRLLATRWDQHKLMLGLEYQANSRQDQSLDDLTTPDVVDLVVPKSGYRVGVYVQDEWSLSDTLSATLGLRYDHNNVTGAQLSPRAALIWQATPDTALKALYGRAHRAPNVFERDYGDGITQVANPGLNRETIDTLELVVDQRVGRSLALRGSIYQWSMQGLVTLGIDPVSGLSQYQSGEEVDALGAEVSADQNWDWGGRLRGSLSYQDVSYKNGAGLLNSPQWLGKLNFSSPLAETGLRLGYELQYNSQRLTKNGTDTGGYILSNLNLMADQWINGLEVSLGIYNLFDVSYEHPAADINWQNSLQQDGRQFRLKAIYTF